MRLDPTEVGLLPLPAALLEPGGQVIARTPEWRGAPPGSLAYRCGQADLVVSPGISDRPEQVAIVGRLLEEMRDACRVMPEHRARGAEVLATSLELVAGWPREPGDGTPLDVLEYTAAAIRARLPKVTLELAPGGGPSLQPVPGPARIALALVQFAANAAAHENATRLRLRVGFGPSFFVEWPASGATASGAAGRRHPGLRRRWGLGYVRVVADALGATALPPAPTERGWTGACLSLGSRRLTLPLALLERGTVVRCTQTWEQEIRTGDAEVQATAAADLRTVLADAEARPGAIFRGRVFAARRTGSTTWVAVAPEVGAATAREVLRGLDHERALWTAPEPYATRVHGLIEALSRSLGAAPVAFAPDAFAREFPRSCATLGLAGPDPGPMLACPDPRVAAFLLSELGGRLVVETDAVWLATSASAAASPLGRLLEPDGEHRIRLTPA